MEGVEFIKNSIEQLYKTNPTIHVSVNKTYSKLILKSSPATIVGVYKNIFQIEEHESSKQPIRHTFQYRDVLIGQVVIEELG